MTFRQRTYGFFVLFCFNRVATYKANLSYCAVWFRSALPGPFVSFLFLRVPPGLFFFFLVAVLIIVAWLCFVGREGVCLFFL